ncbi:hypothetical protein [Natronosalvus caseinilyticus]|uniref:hypothetical protein n=1 Tax=Natronosalvus caseinilyticus TaxID=2953747 RepID=UPI0028ADBDC8|nr:hypothetical protein [Natronosalvus caseinilyticus]
MIAGPTEQPTTELHDDTDSCTDVETTMAFYEGVPGSSFVDPRNESRNGGADRQ